ncbi:hypothetical protein BBF96_03905 [Anoxybacter fermentans]|uniref:Heptaprenyl diphosphate synthase n=1 Tax=Anoxybacter fermentans TaxID=1323375 RepID=A0A3Q9HQX1_9FIRM|nr:polyprenyl synthetase family protein [Anoxybacter fermentans]AZR72605.1 hypothetical protein BBF96_03905 [Anoxybacter fermentans]
MKELWDKYPILKKQLEEFELYLLKILEVRQPLIREAIQELVKAGGKRIRPALVLVSGQFGRISHEELFPIAAAIEIIHMATLVHDDIIDEARVRRGVVTTQAKYGKDIAVFTGDYLFAKSFLLLSGKVDQEFLRRIARSVKYICEGEIDQYQNRYNLNVSYLKYFRRIRRKTAILFQASCFSGGFKAKLKKKYQIVLAKYGHYLGMIFQITDDILDVTSNQEVTGKPVGNDFSQGVYTLPLIFALEDKEVGPELGKALKEEVIDKDRIIKMIHSTDALEKTKRVIEFYTEKARAEIEKLPSSKPARFLEDLLYYIVSRNY